MSDHDAQVSFTIGEMARRARLTPRALRHYESIGLLAPASVDSHSGYRIYGPVELDRCLVIEQLRATGLALMDIGECLRDPSSLAAHLDRKRAFNDAEIERGQRANRLIALLRRGVEPAAVVTLVESLSAVGVRISQPVPVDADRVVGIVRRQISRLLVSCRAHDETVTQTGALFPLDLDERYEIRVFAAIANDVVVDGSHVVLPSVVGVVARGVGSPDSLPATYAACLARADADGLTPRGPIREVYSRTDDGVAVELIVPVAPLEDR